MTTKKHETIDTEVLWAASDAALKGIVETVSTRREPDFTVTAATLKSTGGYPAFFCIAWETKSAGFGELTFYLRGNKLIMDSEAMSREFVMAVFAKLVDQATNIMDDPEEPYDPENPPST